MFAKEEYFYAPFFFYSRYPNCMVHEIKDQEYHNQLSPYALMLHAKFGQKLDLLDECF